MQWIESVKAEYFSVFELDHRTNNALESYHKTLSVVVRSNPTVDQFLDKLKNFVFGAVNIARLQQERNPAAKKLRPLNAGKEEAIQIFGEVAKSCPMTNLLEMGEKLIAVNWDKLEAFTDELEKLPSCSDSGGGNRS